MEKVNLLPYQCLDIARNLLMIRGDEFKALMKDDISLKKAYLVQGILESPISLTDGQEIHAHLQGRKNGKMWLMKINLLHRTCSIHPIIEEELQEGVNDGECSKDSEKKERGGFRETSGRKSKKDNSKR